MAARSGTHNALVACLPLALLCLCRGSGDGGEGGGVSDGTGLRARVLGVVEELRTCRDVAALTLSVVSANGTLLAEGSGLAVAETHTPATANTRVCVASLTKAFTATLLGQLLHKHNASWDSTVRELAGEDWGLGAEVTVRDLLAHRVGLPRYDDLWWSGTLNRTQIFNRIPCMKRASELREKPRYNNILYSLAGHLATLLAGDGSSWEQLVTKHILLPLGMHDTTFVGEVLDDPVKLDTLAAQYLKVNGRRYRLNTAFYREGMESIGPAISMCSTAADMAKWMTFNLHGDKDVLPPDLWRDLHRAVSAVANSSAMYVSHIHKPRMPVSYVLDGYGLGWYTGHYRDLTLLSHFGSFPGSYSHISLLPDLNLGVFSSFNGGHQSYPYIINPLLHTYVLDLLLGEDPWLDNKTMCEFLHGGGEGWELPTHPHPGLYVNSLEPYRGSYVHPVYGQARVDDKGGILRVHYGRLNFTMRLTSLQKDKAIFETEIGLIEWLISSVEVTFGMDADTGEVSTMTLPFLQDFEHPGIFYRSDVGQAQLACNEGASAATQRALHVILLLAALLST